MDTEVDRYIVMKDKKRIVYFIVVFCVGLVINFIRIFQNSVWADECFTINLVKNDVGGIITGIMQDVHPPLYFLICKLFCSCFGYSIAVFRLVSLVPIIILSLSGYRWLTKHCDELTGTIYAFLVLFMPISFYSIEIRMYSWSVLFLTLFVFSMIEVVDYEKYKLIYLASILALLSAYTHYFALVMVAIIYFYFCIKIIIKKNVYLKYIIASIMICIVAYLPWLLIVIKQTTGEDAYSMGFNSIVYYLKPLAGFICLLFGTMRSMSEITAYEAVLTVVLTFIFALVICLYIMQTKENNENAKTLFINVLVMFLVCMVLTYVIGCVMDLMSHKFVTRYLYPLTGIIYIMFAIAMSHFIRNNKRFIHRVIIILGLVIVLFDFGKTVLDERNSDKEQEIALSFIRDSIGDSDVILTDSRLYNWIVFDFYFDNLNYILCLDNDSINDNAQLQKAETYYIHNYSDGFISDPGDGWDYIMTSELGDNRFSIYKYKR